MTDYMTQSKKDSYTNVKKLSDSINETTDLITAHPITYDKRRAKMINADAIQIIIELSEMNNQSIEEFIEENNPHG